MGAPLSHRKRCSLNASSVAPPLILSPCRTFAQFLSVFTIEMQRHDRAAWRRGKQCWLRHVCADQSEQTFGLKETGGKRVCVRQKEAHTVWEQLMCFEITRVTLNVLFINDGYNKVLPWNNSPDKRWFFFVFFDDFTPDIKPFEDPKDCVSSGGADPLNIIKVGLRSDVKLFSEANCALLTLLCNNLCDCSRALQGFRVRSPWNLQENS